jgi:hypothetical protein
MLLSKQETDFLFNTLMPLNFDAFLEGDQKSKMQLLLDAHDPQKLTPLKYVNTGQALNINSRIIRAIQSRFFRLK